MIIQPESWHPFLGIWQFFLEMLQNDCFFIITISFGRLSDLREVVRRCSMKQIFWKVSQMHRKMSPTESFFHEVIYSSLVIWIKKDTTAVVFLWILRIFQKNYQMKHMWTAAPDRSSHHSETRFTNVSCGSLLYSEKCNFW